MRRPKIPKFEVQDYYDADRNKVVDVRVTDAQQRLAALGQTAAHVTTSTNRRRVPTIHGVEVIEHMGSDGDDYSGEIALLHVMPATDTDRPVVGVIHSSYHANGTGIPQGDTSWSVYAAPDKADDLWRNWRPRSFHGQDITDRVARYLKEHPDTDHQAFVGHRNGLLHPWYVQQVDQVALLDSYATAHDRLVRQPQGTTPNDNVIVGQVYVRPVKNEWGYTQRFTARTVLAAYDMPAPAYGVGFHGIPPTPRTLVQWDNGDLDRLPTEEIIGLTPLTSRSLLPKRPF